MMYYVYILRSEKDKHLYIGFTKNLKQRVKFHNKGMNTSTAKRRPLALIYCERYISQKDARKREKFLKSGRGHEVLYQQLEETLCRK